MADNDSSSGIDAKILVIGLVVGLFLGGGFGYLLFSSADESVIQEIQPTPNPMADDLKPRMEEFIDSNLLVPGMSSKVENLSRKGVFELYEIEVTVTDGVQNQIYPGYVTADGSFFFPSGFDLNKPAPDLGSGDDPHSTGAQEPAQNEDINMAALTDDDPSFGQSSAKVIIVEFSDFQCPFCSQVLPTVQRIKSDYGDNVLFVFRDFPLSDIHPEAHKAAQAAQCANDQDMFWEYHDLLFENQGDWNGVGSSKFKEYATDLGLNSDNFNSCLDSDKFAEEVNKDLLEGQHFGVTGTPTFFVNGKKLVGAQPFEEFQKIIDEELAG